MSCPNCEEKDRLASERLALLLKERKKVEIVQRRLERAEREVSKRAKVTYRLKCMLRGEGIDHGMRKLNFRPLARKELS